MAVICIREILVREISVCCLVLLKTCHDADTDVIPLYFILSDTEKEAARIISSILSAVAYLHSRR